MKKGPTKDERLHLARVGQLPCVACLIDGTVSVNNHGAVQLHHIRATAGAGQRSSHYEVIPLCFSHHLGGVYGRAIHAGRKAFEERYGSEEILLEQVKRLLAMV